MKAYVINLEDQPERMANMASQLDAVSCEFVRVQALRTPDNAGAGCLLGHISALALATEMDGKSAEPTLILEDDAIFPPQEGAFEHWVSASLPFQWDALILGCDVLSYRRGPSDWLCRPFNVTQSHAYLVRPHYRETYLRALVSALPHKIGEPDHGPHNVDLYWSTLFMRDNWLSFWPPLVIQDSANALPWRRSLTTVQRSHADTAYGWGPTVMAH